MENKLLACGCTSMEDRNGDCLVPKWVAERILKIRDALVNDDKDEAYHWLYQIASPEFDKLSDDVWRDFEERTGYIKPLKVSPLDTKEQRGEEEILKLLSGTPSIEDYIWATKSISEYYRAKLAAANARIAELENINHELQEWHDSHLK